jgi:hypothetical protein
VSASATRQAGNGAASTELSLDANSLSGNAVQSASLTSELQIGLFHIFTQALGNFLT